jgi:hypothetical protein
MTARRGRRQADGGFVSVEIVDLGTFARQWAVEGRRIAWLLGAGASASARVPTASQIVLDLLARMYAAAHGLVLQELNLGDQSTRDAILAYYDGMNGMPPVGDPSDYSTAFALALPDEGPRRQYFRVLLRDRMPSYGQRVLGALLVQGSVDLVLTTNFDDLLEQATDGARAAQEAPSRPRLGVAALGDAGRANLALSDDDFPFLIKLHGDFRERELKNLDPELLHQDERLRQAFLDASRRFGLAVIGYSGRDASVMAMLAEATRTREALPGGLWWLTRDPGSVLPAVDQLMRQATEAGVTSRYVRIENFDETLAGLGRQATLTPDLRSHVDRLRAEPRVVDAAMPELDRGPLPVLRMNALPIIGAPTRAMQVTLVDDLAPGEVQRLLREGRWRGALARSGQRLLALGSADELGRTLGLATPPAEVPINCQRADAPTIERALIDEAVTRALARRLPTRAIVRDRGNQMRIRPRDDERPDSAQQAAARRLIEEAYDEPLTGLCPATVGLGSDGQRRAFAEAVRLSTEWRLGVLWLLFVPHTWVSPVARRDGGSVTTGDPASAWRKERWVKRRNEKWSAILAAWAKVIAPDSETTIPVLPDGLAQRDLVGGEFVLASTTAYSRVAQ